MKTTLFESEANRKQKSLRQAITFLSTIYGIIILTLSLLWGFLGFLIIYPVFIGLVTIGTMIPLLIILAINNSSKKKYSEIMSIIEKSDLVDLQDILFADQKSVNYRSSLKEYAFLILFETAPVKTMNQLCIKLEEDFNNGICNSEYIKYLKKYQTTEEQKQMYDYLFNAILNLQKAYYYEYDIPQTYGQTSYSYIQRKGAYTMKVLYRLLGFDSIEHFVRSNVVLSFKIIFKDLKLGETVNLNTLARLSRSSENVTRSILFDLLELYPELGDYKEFEMLFIPGKAIVNFDTIVDFDSFIHPLE